eukprot:GFYU01008403.1.p1 GENE.GFYU01008403.1~~GFYU01008403.1.p1  ORF type:complete len:218 (-),score=66.53 GFYU01008403.1:73-726(-)
MTLKDLIYDTKIGQPTKAQAEREAKKAKEKEARRMGEAVDSPTKTTTSSPSKTPTKSRRDMPPPASPSGPRPSVQVTVVNGKIVVNANSLTVSAQQEGDPTADFETIHEGQQHLTSNTYSNRLSTDRWTKHETAKFYDAIRKYGTDFTLIEQLFPNRTRKHIKNKFKKEEKLNPANISAALNNQEPIDVDKYRQEVGLDGDDSGDDDLLPTQPTQSS